jgi:hypothetical protein
VLPPEAAGQPLTLGKFFHYPDWWKDGRFDVADRRQTPGIAGVVNLCGSGASGDTLELRLANNFKLLKLEAGQSNSSENSDQTMLVRIDANGQYRDMKKIKLNQVTSFQIPVDHVNALKIIVSLDQDDKECGMGTVEAVLMNLVLS